MLNVVHPWFLLGLSGLAIPVVLHLMNRERANPRQFPSIRFIQATRIPQEGRRQLRDLLLLVVRLLVLACAVLAIAHPLWVSSPSTPSPTAGHPRELVLMVDCSASMDGWGGFAAARKAAEQTLAAHPNAAAGLVTFPATVHAAVPLTSPRGELRAALAQLKPTALRGEPAPALRTALRLFSAAEPRLLVVISDFQTTDWQDVQFAPIPPGTRLELVPVNPRRQGNAGILTSRSTPLADGSVRITATVRNFGTDTVSRELRIQCGGQTLARPVQLPPRQNRDVSFLIPQPASARAEIRLTPDSYPGDDLYLAAVGRRPPIRALAVVPLGAEPAKQQEFFFVRKALETSAGTDAKVYTVESVEPEFFAALRLAEFPIVFLLGAGGYFQEPEWQLCRQYAEDGGWLVCTPGNRAFEQFQAVRQFGFSADDFVGIKRFDTAAEGLPFNVAWVNPDGPLAAYASESYDSELFLFAIARYAQVRPGTGTRVLLRASTDDPLLTDRPLGKGRVLQFTYGFDLGWSEMAMTTAFLPILRELAATAVPIDYGAVRVDCGGPLPETLTRQLRGTRSDNRPRPAAPDLLHPGVEMVGQTPVEINVSRQESVVEQTDSAVIQSRLAGPLAESQLRSAAAGTGTTQRTRDLLPALAASAMLLLLLETVLAAILDRRGRRRSGAETNSAGPEQEASTP